MVESETQQITYVSELARKSIHLASLFIPIIYLHIDHTLGIEILVAMTAFSFLLDLGRHYHEPTRKVLFKFVGPLLRHHEALEPRFRMTGATWVLIAATLTLGLFPTIVGVTAFTILIVSDTSAALIGRRYGTTPFLDKSVVGTVAFAVSAVGVVIVYGIIYSLPSTYYIGGAISAVVSAIAEASSVRFRFDDNIAIPFSVAIVMLGVQWIGTSMGFPSFIYLLP